MQRISQHTLSDLSEQAKNSPRLRKNLNFHADNEAACHRLLNALEPGTYVQPHCHLSPDKEETLIVLAGRIGVLIFNADGSVAEHFILSPRDNDFGVTIPATVFHSMVALESGAVFFEAKAGPYVPIAEEEKASWAPAETDTASADYLQRMLTYFEA
ncbi:MAG: WbuC family cupin fold metalloprotein [Burkholderiales bacterium]|nr:WbuC family cupin fold metalloprotein [Burkholderiales bacterium]